MSQANFGNQNIDHNYLFEVSSEEIASRNVDIIPTGIFDGFELEVESTNSVRVYPGTIEIQDHRDEWDHQIRVRTDEEEVLTGVDETTPYIVAEWEFERIADSQNNAQNFVRFFSVQNPTDENWVVLGRGEFDQNGNLVGLDTRDQVRDDADLLNTEREHLASLRPEPTDPPSLQLFIDGDQYILPNNEETITIDDQLSPQFSLPSNNPRIDLLVVTPQGDIDIIEGGESSTPEAPTYQDGFLTLAEVKLSPSSTAIEDRVRDLSTVSEGFRDVRPILSLSNIDETPLPYVENIETTGQTIVDPGFEFENDGRNILVARNGQVVDEGIDREWRVLSDNRIEFNDPLAEGDRVSVRRYSGTGGASAGGSGTVSLHAETHQPNGSDPIVWESVLFEDESQDGSRWEIGEDQSTGDLLVQHPNLSSPVTITKEGEIQNQINSPRQLVSTTDEYQTQSNTYVDVVSMFSHLDQIDLLDCRYYLEASSSGATAFARTTVNGSVLSGSEVSVTGQGLTWVRQTQLSVSSLIEAEVGLDLRVDGGTGDTANLRGFILTAGESS